MIFDTSAKWPETLAEPPKPLANWSLAKRRNVIASVASWAFQNFWVEKKNIMKEILKLQRVTKYRFQLKKCYFIDLNLSVAATDYRMYDQT